MQIRERLLYLSTIMFRALGLQTLAQPLRARLPGLLVCSVLATAVSAGLLITPGYVSAGDLVPPYDISNYFAYVTSPWNFAYSFGNVGANSAALLTSPLYFFHFVLGFDALLSDKLWIFFFYWLAGMVFHEASLNVIPDGYEGRPRLARAIATSAFMLSPITLTDIVVPTLLIAGPPVFLALLELKRFVEFRAGSWSLLKFALSISLAGFYYPSAFFAIIFSAVILTLVFLRTKNRVGFLRRTLFLLGATTAINFYWLVPLANSFFSQGSLYGSAQVPAFNISELYGNWSAQYGWTALAVISLTRTVFTPSLRYAAANVPVIISSLMMVVVAMSALMVAQQGQRRISLLLSSAALAILFLSIRDRPIIDSLAYILEMMWNSGIPLRVEIWNLVKQPSIMLNYLPGIYGLLIGIALFGFFTRLSQRDPLSMRSMKDDRLSCIPMDEARASPQHRKRVRFPRVQLAGVLMCVIMVVSLSVVGVQYSVELYRAFNPAPIPDEFYALNTYFRGQSDSGRLLFLPPRAYGGFLYGWWPDWGIPIVTWPLYAATPPSPLLDSSTPQSWNFLLYLYLQGLVRGRTTSMGPLLSSLGGTHVAYSSQFLTPGLNVAPERILARLQNQTGLSLVLEDGSLRIFRVSGQSPAAYATNSVGLVIGSLSTMLDSYRYGYNASRAPLATAYQLNGEMYNMLLRLSNYVIVAESEGLQSLALLMNSERFVQPSSTRQEPSWANVAESSLMWVFDGLSNDLDGDLLFGGGASVSRTANSTLSVLVGSDDGDYGLWARLAKSPEGGYLRVFLDNMEIAEVATNQTSTQMVWVKLATSRLTQGSHKIDIINGEGLNAVNVVSLIPEVSYQSSLQELSRLLLNKEVYIVGKDTLKKYDPAMNTTQQAGTITIPEKPLPMDFRMIRQGQYEATIRSSGPSFVVLTEYFDTAFTSPQSSLHFPVQYMMNGYLINSTGRTVVDLRYEATNLVEGSRLVSLTSGIVLFASIVAYPKLRGVVTNRRRFCN